MKTCKMGCGKMKSGGTIKKVKKMAMGGSATNKLNNPKAPTKPMKGGGNTKMGIYGVPNAGPTGPNIQGINTMKKGGAVRKLVKAQKGISVKKSSTPADSAKIYKDQYNAAFDRKMDERFFNKSFPSAAGKKRIKEKQAEEDKAYNNMTRQYNKGKEGYTEMGFKIQPKDKQGRSSTSKWYGFDPKTKKYTMGPNKGKTHAQVMKSRTTKK